MRVDSRPSGDEDMEGYVIGICLNEVSGELATMKGIYVISLVRSAGWPFCFIGCHCFFLKYDNSKVPSPKDPNRIRPNVPFLQQIFCNIPFAILK